MELFQIIQIFISMRLDIDDLIMFMEKFIGSDKLEMGEQEGEAPKYKWESGLTRGHGNPVP